MCLHRISCRQLALPKQVEDGRDKPTHSRSRKLILLQSLWEEERGAGAKCEASSWSCFYGGARVVVSGGALCPPSRHPVDHTPTLTRLDDHTLLSRVEAADGLFGDDAAEIVAILAEPTQALLFE